MYFTQQQPQLNLTNTQQFNQSFQSQQYPSNQPIYESPYTQQYFDNRVMNTTIPNQYQHQRQPSNMSLGGTMNQTGGILQQTQSYGSREHEQLQKMLEKQCLTSRINLQEQYINDDGAEVLSQILVKYKNINYIELKGNNISSQGFVHIFESLKSNFQIKVLGLQWNRIGGSDLQGLENLYALMANNRSITHIDLRNNRINETGAHILSNIIRQNNTLKSLDLRWNEIGNTGARAILAALQDNYSICSLELAGNSIQETIIQQVQQITVQNKEGNERNMRRNMMGPEINNQSLNERDLDFVSRNQQQDPYLIQSQQLLLNQTQQNPSLQNTQQNFARTAALRDMQQPTIPYEQERILQHLQSLIEDERIFSLQTKEDLTKRVNEKKSGLDSSKAKIQLQEEQLADLQNSNQILKNDLREIQQDLKQFEEEKKRKLTDTKAINLELENEIREKDKENQIEMNNIAQDKQREMKHTEEDYEDKLERLRSKHFQLKCSLDDGRIALNKIQDEMIKSDLETKEKAKEIVEQLKEDGKRNYKAEFDYLQSRLRKVQEGKINAKRVMDNYQQERNIRQKDYANQIKDIEVQSAKRKIDIEDIGLRNKDYEIQERKIKNDIKNKDTIEKLLKKERDSVQHQFQTNEKEVRKIQEEMELEHKKERNRVEGLLEVQRKRITELENIIKDTTQQNSILRSDYNRLQELLSSNLSKSIYNCFRDKNVI